MNANYTGDVTLANSFFDSIVQFSFGIADSGLYNLFRPILKVLLSAVAVLQKV